MKHIKIMVGCSLAAMVFALSCSPGINRTQNFRDKKVQAAGAMPLKVMSYNIHHCNPPSQPGVIDLDAVVNAIQQQAPDIVALQEVDVNTGRSGRVNQAAAIASRLNMHYFFGKAIDHDGGEYGVAMLSKYPLTETSVHRLPTKDGSGGEPRVLATAKVELPGSVYIRFGATHLDAQKDPANRLLQVDAINKMALNEKLPFVLAGDFNASPETEVVRSLDVQFKRTCEPCAFTFPEKNPTVAIDFIAYKPVQNFNVVSHEVIAETYASDHRPVLAILNFRK